MTAPSNSVPKILMNISIMKRTPAGIYSDRTEGLPNNGLTDIGSDEE